MIGLAGLFSCGASFLFLVIAVSPKEHSVMKDLIEKAKVWYIDIGICRK